MTNKKDKPNSSNENVFPKKYMTKVSSDLKDSAEGMAEDELKRKIIEFEKAMCFAENELSMDPDILSLKEQLKNASSDLKEEITMLNSNIKYCIYILNGRGTV